MKQLLPILFLFLSTSVVFGQEATPSAIQTPNTVSITAIPPRLELSALPGATIQETIKIRNESATEMAFDVSAVDFIVNDSQGTPVAVTEAVSGRWSLASWITASPKKILLQPQQTTTVNLVIAIPKDALAGGRYAMITYNPNTEGLLGIQGSGSAIVQKVGSLIYLNVVGNVTEAGHLKEFKVDSQFSQYGPINLLAEIENLGDIHIQPQGQITVTNWLKDTVGQFQLEPKNIFPFTSRMYELSVPGKYRFGRYTARLDAIIGSSQIPVHGLIYFWIIPIKEVSLIAAALILIVLLIVLKTRKKKPLTPIDLPQENPTLK